MALITKNMADLRYVFRSKWGSNLRGGKDGDGGWAMQFFNDGTSEQWDVLGSDQPNTYFLRNVTTNLLLSINNDGWVRCAGEQDWARFQFHQTDTGVALFAVRSRKYLSAPQNQGILEANDAIGPAGIWQARVITTCVGTLRINLQKPNPQGKPILDQASSVTVRNATRTAQKPTMEIAGTVAETVTLTTTVGFEIERTIEVKAGVEKVGEVSSKLSFAMDMEWSSAKTSGKERKITTTCEVDVPPTKGVKATLWVNKQKLEIPYVAQMIFQNGNRRFLRDVEGVLVANYGETYYVDIQEYKLNDKTIENAKIPTIVTVN
ncbi:hypothetical protein BJ742DRAFT_824937 [Cladochytrium replicatum]|nr:hypothetical protein BJ742DRAFT_824937 [Cladochytrium replicatum]